jgi:anhydro-N-acetylmuramic acid kinase
VAAALYLGLACGPRMAGVDAALIELDEKTAPRLLAAQFAPYPERVRSALADLPRAGDEAIDRLGRLDVELGRFFSQAAIALLEAAGVDGRDVRAIGSEGQTLRHRPDVEPPFLLELGDPNSIAEITGLTTVADFRRRDLAAHGEGVPLVPAYLVAMLADPREDRAVLEVADVARLTLIPARGRTTAFDTGPANALLDAWAARHLGSGRDEDGAWADVGRVDSDLLETLLSDPYFDRPPPKRAAPELFNPSWLEAQLEGRRLQPADTQATLTALSADAAVSALRGRLPACRRLFVCGRAVGNRTLMARLERSLAGCAVESTAKAGVDPEWIRAAAFAWLARETLARRPANRPELTGADRSVVLGGIYEGALSPP